LAGDAAGDFAMLAAFLSVTGAVCVQVDPRYFRPTEVDELVGHASKARDRLGWRPEIEFDALVAEMVRADPWVVPGEPASMNQ
jgi:GDP-D-mannose dehydratase